MAGMNNGNSEISLFELFEQDLIAERRNATESAGVIYDPESLLTGSEIEEGLGYYDKRVWVSREAYEDAICGRIELEEMPLYGPRVKGNLVTYIPRD